VVCPAAREALADEQRFAILRRLLHDEDLDLRYRFTGSVLLLYGQPITRIAVLATTDIDITRGGAITLDSAADGSRSPTRSLRSH
jgi:hypothetical protein